MIRTCPAQTPESSLTVDHAAHFVPDIGDAGTALETLGFTLTPFSAQRVQPENGGPAVNAGTGNRCVMLQRGYLEFLAPTHDTPNARQLHAAMRRYTGIHLIAFGSADGRADHARLSQSGFDPLAPIALQREVGTAAGSGTARFTVVRVPPGAMAEGRIQYCQHHTPELVWQPRWVSHRNHICGLAGLIICVANVEEAARRYARFTGLPVRGNAEMQRLDTVCGTVFFIAPHVLSERLHASAPALPWIAGAVLETNNYAQTEHAMRNAGVALRTPDERRMLVELPPALGGIMIVQREGSDDIQELFIH